MCKNMLLIPYTRCTAINYYWVNKQRRTTLAGRPAAYSQKIIVFSDLGKLYDEHAIIKCQQCRVQLDGKITT